MTQPIEDTRVALTLMRQQYREAHQRLDHIYELAAALARVDPEDDIYDDSKRVISGDTGSGPFLFSPAVDTFQDPRWQ